MIVLGLRLVNSLLGVEDARVEEPIGGKKEKIHWTVLPIRPCFASVALLLTTILFLAVVVLTPIPVRSYPGGCWV
jgi:hypothetical protein